MQIRDIPWQKQGDNWPAFFIREHFLAIAATAWAGFLQHGRGLVIGEVTLPSQGWVDWRQQAVAYRLAFLPLPEALDYLKQTNLPSNWPDEEYQSLRLKLAEYCAEGEIFLGLQGQGETLVLQLQNLAIAPRAAYAQFCQRREEFPCGPFSGPTLI